MPDKTYKLEICVDDWEQYQSALKGGADRIELCSRLDVGGLTPSTEFTRYALQNTNIPIYVMIRPEGKFVFSDSEADLMVKSIKEMKQLGVQGVVSGGLREDGSIDLELLQRLIDASRPLPFTFHKAFDRCNDLEKGLEILMNAGVDTVLTSGGAPSVTEGIETLKSLKNQAGQKIEIMPGGKIRAKNIACIKTELGSQWYHSGSFQEASVREMKKKLNEDED